MLGKCFLTFVADRPGIFKKEASARTSVDLGGKERQACQYLTNSRMELI